VLLPSLTLFGVLHHDSVKRSLLREVDETLTNRAREVRQVIQKSPVKSVSDFADFHMMGSALQLTSAPEVYVDIVDVQGNTLWASPNLAGQTIPNVSGELPTSITIESIEQPDGLRLRRLVQPLRLEDGSQVVLVLAESLTHMEAALQGSIGRTVLLGLVVLTLTEVLGNLAFRGIFYPLRELVDTAEAIISTDDVTRRVPVGQDSDPEIERAAHAFNNLMERVEQLLEMAKRLLADTSHELRNPLTVLMTDLDMLREELTPEQREEVIDEAQKTVRRLNRLVADLLLLSRTEAHSQRLEREEIEATNLVRKVARRFNRSLDEEGVVTVESAVDSAIVNLDRERTEQILINLFENGVRYSDGHEIKVRIYLESGQVVVSVKDRGCGIPPDEQEKVFHRFYRIDRSRNRHSGGTGLGLPVARALARLQNGDIVLESEVGKGSDFQLRLPLVTTT